MSAVPGVLERLENARRHLDLVDSSLEAQRAQITDPAASSPVVVTLSEVVPERVTWLWPSRIPAGKVTLLVGDPEAGKSTIALDIAARLTTGHTMPDGVACERADVLFCTLEDGLADTVRPRLDAAGGDPGRVHSVTGMLEHTEDGRPRGERVLEFPADLPYVETIIKARSVRLLILDPLKAYMHGGVNEFRDGDVRRLLGPVAAMAERTGVAVLAILHLTKSPVTPAQYRVSGSIAFTGAARSVLLAAPDPQAPDSGRRVLAPMKASLSERAPTLAYRIVSADGTRDGAAKVEWEGPCEVTARQALAAQTEDVEGRSALEEAVAFLEQELAEGPRPAKEMLRLAEQAGIPQRTLARARQTAAVHASRTGFGPGGTWVWSLNGNHRVPEGDIECHTRVWPPMGDAGTLCDGPKAAGEPFPGPVTVGHFDTVVPAESPEQAERTALREGA